MKLNGDIKTFIFMHWISYRNFLRKYEKYFFICNQVKYILYQLLFNFHFSADLVTWWSRSQEKRVSSLNLDDKYEVWWVAWPQIMSNDNAIYHWPATQNDLKEYIDPPETVIICFCWPVYNRVSHLYLFIHSCSLPLLSWSLTETKKAEKSFWR